MAAANKSNMVSIFVPKVAGEDPILWVGLNGQSWSIPRGKRIEVPKDVAEIVYQRESNMQIADEYADEKRRDLDAMMHKFTNT
jgi:hypothetical protein